ncbi:MAG TPA: hypothetical protein VHE30_26165 [Polyangiaceae bacterium]|nr:hypothetical protein [Polyangiaceae bacterium]
MASIVSRGAVACAALLLLARPVLADAPASGAARPDRAEEAFRRGTAAFEAGEYSDAYAELRAAWDLSPSYRTAGGLGQVELGLAQYRDAATHLSACLRMFPRDGDPAARAHVEQGLAQARAHVAALRVRVDVPGATLTVDRIVVGHAPIEELVFVDPGHRVIEAAAPNHDPTAVAVDAIAGRTQDVELTLGPAGARGGSVPVPVHDVPPRRKLARLPRDSTANAADGVAPSTWALAVGGGITVAFMATAAVFLGKSVAASSDASSLRSELSPAGGCVEPTPATRARCDDLSDLVDARNRDDVAVTAASIGAGVAALATVGLYFALSPRERAQSASISVGARRDVAGVSAVVRGAF